VGGERRKRGNAASPLEGRRRLEAKKQLILHPRPSSSAPTP
jgi:hypothetical protein